VRSLESLPQVFWIIYIFIISITLAASIVYWIKQRFSALAVIAMILSLLIPLVAFIYTAQRETGNGYEYMMEKVLTLDWLAILIIVGYIYITGWLIFVITEVLLKLYHVPLINEKVKPVFQKGKRFWNKKINQMKQFLILIQEKLPKRKKIAEENLEEESKQSN
jgi:hypothetical protein